MVAVINTGHSIRSIFNYNENKVSLGKAECIGEGNYPIDLADLTLDSKLKTLLKQLELNKNVTRNSVHISLNFDQSEKEFSNEKLMEIAQVYMDKIGFGSQPYLVYRHYDAAHPHIHIVSIKVKSDGKRIDMQNIGKNQSENARREIEKDFNLIPAESKKISNDAKQITSAIQKIQYGDSDSKKAISGVLNYVIPNYKFTTIGELNAVLNLYNISAERGLEGSKMYQHKGLMYQILDEQKKPIGVPIKASSFYLKPTLKNLELRFEANKKMRVPHMKRIKNCIDFAFLKNKRISLEKLDQILSSEGINMVMRKNSEGLLYGITYIDHTSKCIFNGSTLGSSYAAKAIQERCEDVVIKSQNKILNNSEHTEFQSTKNGISFISAEQVQKMVDSIISPEYNGEYIPKELKGTRRKRKRKGQSDNQ
ncbi:relaxase/mobilization nuclease domain-containing protein [Flavobacterium sp.]|uniref:relaxase/mobilization nuclease domain-containing protein n=1 Tax=Flavobacterium sp. TaxID=239 RepID=UPI0031D4C3E6